MPTMALTSTSEVLLLSPRSPPHSPPLTIPSENAAPVRSPLPNRRSLLGRFLKRPHTSSVDATDFRLPPRSNRSRPEIPPKVLQRVILHAWCSPDLTQEERYRLYASSMCVSKAWRSLFLRVSSTDVFISNTFDYVRYRSDGYIRQPRLELMALAQHENHLRASSRLGLHTSAPTLPAPSALPPPKALCRSVTLTATFDSPISTPTIYDIYGYSSNALSRFLSDGTGLPLRNLTTLNLTFVNAGLPHVIEALAPAIPPQVIEVHITWAFEDPHRRAKRITALEKALLPVTDNDDSVKVPRGAVCFPSAWPQWPGVRKLSFEDGATAGLIGSLVCRCPNVEEVSFEGRPEVRNSSSARQNTGEWMKFFKEKKEGEKPKEKFITWFHEAPIINIRRVRGYGTNWEGRLVSVQREAGGVLRRGYQVIG